MNTERRTHIEWAAYADEHHKGEQAAFLAGVVASQAENLVYAAQVRRKREPKHVVSALALRAARIISAGDTAELSAPVEGEAFGKAAIAARDALLRQPVKWMRDQVPHLPQIMDAYASAASPMETNR